MPKGIPNLYTELKTQVDYLAGKIEYVPGQIESLSRQLKELAQVVSSLLKEDIKKTEVKAEIRDASAQLDTHYPIPSEYTQAVHDILNQEFNIRLNPRSDVPAFEFEIVVPEKYSSISPEKRSFDKEDCRLKVITYAEGTNGVKEYCGLVYNTFSPEIRALISSQRS